MHRLRGVGVDVQARGRRHARDAGELRQAARQGRVAAARRALGPVVGIAHVGAQQRDRGRGGGAGQQLLERIGRQQAVRIEEQDPRRVAGSGALVARDRKAGIVPVADHGQPHVARQALDRAIAGPVVDHHQPPQSGLYQHPCDRNRGEIAPLSCATTTASTAPAIDAQPSRAGAPPAGGPLRPGAANALACRRSRTARRRSVARSRWRRATPASRRATARRVRHGPAVGLDQAPRVGLQVDRRIARAANTACRRCTSRRAGSAGNLDTARSDRARPRRRGRATIRPACAGAARARPRGSRPRAGRANR